MEQDSKNSLDFVYEFYKTIKKHKITLVYEGDITHQLTKAFTSLTESNMAKEEESGSVQRRVFHVMVECLQNLCKHTEEKSQDQSGVSGHGVFIVSRNESEYCVTTCNPIESSKIESLKNMLDHLNQLDKEQLNDLYKKQIKEGSISDKGGAGLGLIDIARKTGNRLEYKFIPFGDDQAFFIMMSTISREV